MVAALGAWFVWTFGTDEDWRPFQAPDVVEIVSPGGSLTRLAAAGPRLVAGDPLSITFTSVDDPRRIEVLAPTGKLQIVLGDGPAGGAVLTLGQAAPKLATRQTDGAQQIAILTAPEGPARSASLSYEEGGYVARVDGSDLGPPAPGPPPDGRAGLRALAAGASFVRAEVADRDGRARRLDTGATRQRWWVGLAVAVGALLATILTRLWWRDVRPGAPAAGRAALLLALAAPAWLATSLVLRIDEDNRERLAEPHGEVATDILVRDELDFVVPGRPLDLGTRVDADALLTVDVVLDEVSAIDLAVRASPVAMDRQILITLSTDPALPGGVAQNLGTRIVGEPSELRPVAGRSHRLQVRCEDQRIVAHLDGALLGALTDLDLRLGHTTIHALSGRARISGLRVEPLHAPRALTGVLRRWQATVLIALALGLAILALVSGRPRAALAWTWPLAAVASPFAPGHLAPYGAALALLLLAATPPRGRRLPGWLAGALVLGTCGWSVGLAAERVTPAVLNAMDVSDVSGPAISPDYVWARHRLVRRFNSYVRDQTFRGARVARRATEGSARIVAIGTSSTKGHGVAADETYTFALGEILRARGRSVETINAGIPGSTAERLRFFLEGVILDLAPDLVIIDLGFNDHIASGVHDERAHFEAITSDGIGPAEGALARLREHFVSRTFARYRAGRAAARDPDDVTRFTTVPAARFGASLRDMILACRAAGARVLLVEEPTLPGAVRPHLIAFRDAMARVADELGVERVTPQARMDEAGGAAWLDVVHPTPGGHLVLAEILADAVIERGLLP